LPGGVHSKMRVSSASIRASLLLAQTSNAMSSRCAYYGCSRGIELWLGDMDLIFKGGSAQRRGRDEPKQPSELVVELYRKAIRLVELAIQGYQAQDRDLMRINLIGAQTVVSELRRALDRDTGAVGDDLDRMYGLLYRKLSQAQLHQDPNVAQEVVGYLTEMLSTWQYVAQER
jgi:flagellar biosynthetic protein FliS